MDGKRMDVDSDYELNEALEADLAQESDGLTIQNQRLARIQEYEESALSRIDPLDAVIGIGNASFQRVFEHLGAAVLEELDSHAHTVDEFRKIGPEIRLLVKLRNTIETDLAVQSHNAAQQEMPFRHGPRDNGPSSKLAARMHELLPKRSRMND